ncbi:hypothetical protein PYCCODRAFT_1460559 [Trametes coccinea BRFM310]|uniref:Uncharacterized protein n=1 Tax=Trametes coccinea (strain BRFM310) TaxID=1353009 RepID=A0A1Y2IGX0_TRAC3|nr:hypothetical protein PYCCODRAFT_1460559 [Trametes coccinea BRFM310]
MVKMMPSPKNAHSTSNPPQAQPPTPPKSPSGGPPRRTGTPSLRIKTGPTTNTSRPPTPPQTNSTSQTANPMTGLDRNTTTAINDLLSTNQRTLKALGETFEILGQQTIMVATLGPALEAMTQIEALKREVKQHGEKQDTFVQKLESKIKRQVDADIEKVLRPAVNEMVKDAVQNMIATRVEDALKRSVTQEVRDRLQAYETRILAVKIQLTNAEAKRWNSQIRSIDVPLRPFARPIGSEDVSSSTTNGTSASGSGKPRNTPGKNRQNASNPRSGSSSSSGSQDGGGTADGPGAAGQPLFPRFVQDIPKISARDARRLVVEHGIKSGSVADGIEDDWEDLGEASDEKGSEAGAGAGAGAANGHGQGGRGGGASGNTTKPKDKDKDKELKEKEKKEKERREKLAAREVARRADLNEFMRFIGLTHICLPSSLSPVAARNGAESLRSPLLSRNPFSP